LAPARVPHEPLLGSFTRSRTHARHTGSAPADDGDDDDDDGAEAAAAAAAAATAIGFLPCQVCPRQTSVLGRRTTASNSRRQLAERWSLACGIPADGTAPSSAGHRGQSHGWGSDEHERLRWAAVAGGGDACGSSGRESGSRPLHGLGRRLFFGAVGQQRGSTRADLDLWRAGALVIARRLHHVRSCAVSTRFAVGHHAFGSALAGGHVSARPHPIAEVSRATRHTCRRYQCRSLWFFHPSRSIAGLASVRGRSREHCAAAAVAAAAPTAAAAAAAAAPAAGGAATAAAGHRRCEGQGEGQNHRPPLTHWSASAGGRAVSMACWSNHCLHIACTSIVGTLLAI